MGIFNDKEKVVQLQRENTALRKEISGLKHWAEKQDAGRESLEMANETLRKRSTGNLEQLEKLKAHVAKTECESGDISILKEAHKRELVRRTASWGALQEEYLAGRRLERGRKKQILALENALKKKNHKLKKQKGTAVAKVEQGVCCGCRISLPSTELQRARSDSLVRCSSCGRILFLA